jgi:solute carrier family 35
MKAPARGGVVFQALWPCAFYFVCSFAMNMLTKTLLTGYGWRAIYALGAMQNTFTMLALGTFQLYETLSAAWRSASDEKAAPVKKPAAPPVSRARFYLRVMLPLVALHIGNMVLGFAAMRVVNMPMYLVLRRLTTIKVLMIESLVLRKELSTGIKLALLGAFVRSASFYFPY